MNEYTNEEKVKINQCLISIKKRMDENVSDCLPEILQRLSSCIDSIPIGRELLNQLQATSSKVLDLECDLQNTISDIKSEVGVLHD